MSYLERSRRNTWYLFVILGAVIIALIALVLIRTGVISLGGGAEANGTPTADMTTTVETTSAGAGSTPSATTPEPTAGSPLVTATVDTPIYNAPGEDSTIIARMTAGQSATVSGISSDGEWWQIAVPDDTSRKGWVSAADVIAENIENVPVVDPDEPQQPEQTVTPESEARVTADTNLNIRSAPNIIAEIIGLLETGQSAKVLGISINRNWWYIEVPDGEGENGFVAVEFVTAENTDGVPTVDDNGNPIAGELPIPTPPPNSPSLTALVNLNIRSQAGIQSDIIGLLNQGQRAIVVGRSSDGAWWAINIPSADNGRGWVSADFVTAENTDEVPVIEN